ncbi:MAG: sulfatase-like hydrolase/transferase [Planctomycetota bacterium]
MFRRRILFCTAALLGSLSAIVVAEHPQQKSTASPNIVVVFIDDLGWADFSCFGNSDALTPNIDRLAAGGIRFEQFYVNSPICSPSRVALSTGQYPARWGITSYLDNRKTNEARGVENWLSTDAPTLARILQANGYKTGHFGKWHMGGQRDVGDAPLITEYGFDTSLTNFEGLGPRILGLKDAYDGSEPRQHAMGSQNLGRGEITWLDRSQVTRAFTDAAIEFINEAQAEERPFYLNLWPDDVHAPFFPPEEMRGDGTRRVLYHGVLETMDEQLGSLFNLIREDDRLRDNTLVLICSDNGPAQGAGSAGPFRGFKTHLFEGGIRSPLIAWAPGLIPEEKSGALNTDSVFSSIDLVPSLLEIARIGMPDGIEFDGEVLADVVTGRSNASRIQPLFFRRPPDRDSFYGIEDCPDLAVRSGKWKLLCEYDGSDAMLFDLSVDAGEATDISGENSDIVQKLTSAVVEWHNALPQDNGATYRIDRQR